MIVYVDMDNVLCDCDGAIRTVKVTKPEMPYPQAEYGFFLKLDPLPGALDGIRALAEVHDVWILTRPSVINPMCYLEKRVWVENHLGLPWCYKLILSPDKALLRGDILVDDNPWPGFQGVQLLFGSQVCPNWAAVLNYLLPGSGNEYIGHD